LILTAAIGILQGRFFKGYQWHSGFKALDLHTLPVKFDALTEFIILHNTFLG